MITYMKIKHHSIFNDLKADNIDWEKLRDNPKEIHYYIPKNKNEYISFVEAQGQYKKTCQELRKVINEYRMTKILSLGCGRAHLEYNLSKMVDIKIDVSDLTESIIKIKSFKIFNNAYLLDFSKKFNLEKNEYQLVLLSRIDTELSDNQLEDLFESLYNSNIKCIYFIPAELLNFKTLLVEIKLFIKSLLYRKKRVFCGYARTEKSLISKWKGFYNFKKDSQNNYLLYNDTI